MARINMIQFRRGTATEWANANPILADGEVGFDRTNNEVRIGNGGTHWNDLPPIGGGVAEEINSLVERVGGLETSVTSLSDSVAENAAEIASANDSIESATRRGLYVSESAKPHRPAVDYMIERFAPGHGWQIFSGTAGSMSDDTQDYALGVQSLCVTTKTDGTPGSVQKTGLAIDLTGKQVTIWVKVSGAIDLTQLLLYAGDATLANNYSWTIANAGIEQQVFREGEWAPIVLTFADAASTGSPSRSNITTLRIRVGAASGKSVTLRVGGIGVSSDSSPFPNGVISFACDDSYSSQYSIMRPILDGYGWSATAYTIVDLLGTPGFMTMDQLKTLELVNGWNIAGHAFTSAMHAAGYGNDSMLPQIEQDVRSLRQWLVENGFSGQDHLAYPKGFFTAASQGIMGRYFATGRTVINRMTESVNPSDRMRLRSLSVTNTTTIATAKALVDRVKAGKGWGIITIHDLVATPTVGTQWPTAAFQSLVDYIALQGVPVLNIKDVIARSR